MSDGENIRDDEVRFYSFIVPKNKDEVRETSEDLSKPWGSWKIYRVPHNLKAAGGNLASYVPQIVSLGPYHFGSDHLKPMESHKERALQVMLHRTSKDKNHYLNELQEIESRARGWYQEGPTVEQLDPENFVNMLLLDGVFMLEIIMGNNFGFDKKYYSADDPIFTRQGYIRFTVLQDMIKLENQIPLFVLDKLLQLGIWYDASTEVAQDGNKPVAWYVVPLFSHWWVTKENLNDQERESLRCSIIISDNKLLHCLDIFRRCLLHRFGDDHQQEDKLNESRANSSKFACFTAMTPSSNAGNQSQQAKCTLPTVCKDLKNYLPSCGGADLEHASDKKDEESNNLVPEDDDDDDVEVNMISCVTKLKESGVKFRRRNGRHPFWDIEFQTNGVLEMPQIVIDDFLEQIFRNLIAFEQCHSHKMRKNEAVITAYTTFMDNLINTAEDVGHLHKAGIIVHRLGNDEEVAELFNSLCKRVYFDSRDGHYKDYFKSMNKYCHTRPNRWMAELKRSKFKNPWTIISLFAAVTLLVLTGIQTAYTVASYNKQ